MTDTPKPILVVGSANVDFIMQAPHLPRVGETVTNCVFQQVFGGKGANQAVAAARTGGQVTFITCVGQDLFGPRMIENFQADGMDTRLIKTSQTEPSGSALVMFDKAGENYLTVAPGANFDLLPEDIDERTDAIRNAGLILMQMEIPESTNLRVMEEAKEAGVPVMFNYAPVREKQVPVNEAITWLVVNEGEAAALCGMPSVDVDSAPEAADRLLAMGPLHVVITLGKKGACYRGQEGAETVPAYVVESVDTTAAGDTFCGALGVAIVNGRPVREALQFANAAAALCVGKAGAQPSIPREEDVMNFLRQK